MIAIDVVPDGFSEPLAVLCAERDGFVQDAAGVFGHAEAAFVDLGVHFFRCVPHERQLEIVDDAGSVHGHGRDDAAFHEIDEERGEAHLDHMSADTDDDRPPLAMGRRDCGRHGAQCFHREQIG